jgi:hypothetical protein
VSLALVLSEPVVRDAVLEGLKTADVGNAKLYTGIADAVGDADIAAILVDHPPSEVPDIRNRTKIFVLGDADKAWHDHAAIEILPKPARLGHLLARIMYHLKSHVRAHGGTVTIGRWSFNPQNRSLTDLDTGQAVRLTEKETSVLDCLAQSEMPVRRDELLATIWGHDDRIETHTLETHIYQLRRKLEEDGARLVNEGGDYSLKH